MKVFHLKFSIFLFVYMQENIGPRTVTNFYDAAVTYGNPALRQECFSWLLKNLMTSSPEFLIGISTELMIGLVENSDLFVMQVVKFIRLRLNMTVS